MLNTGESDACAATLSVDAPEACGIRCGDGITYFMAVVSLADMTEVGDWGRSFVRTGIARHFAGFNWRVFEVPSANTPYKMEHVYLVWR
jgi:hypothetical protein